MQTKTIKTKLLTALLALCMLLSLIPMTAVTAFAANTATVNNETELTTALNNADYTEIKLDSNIETTGKLYVERTVTLDLNGHTLSCSSENTDIIWVRANGNLTIKDSGTGGKIDGQEKNCGIFIKGGVLTLESGSIVNCYDKIIDEYSGDGAAVDLETNGRFIMNGGAIEDCRAGDDGGAIDIGSGCTFVMNGGAIKNCKATKNGGAVIVKDKAKFEMNDGLIEGCSVTTVDGTGGGVYIENVGRFVMSGGTIKDCTRYYSDYYGYIGNGVAGDTFSKAEIVLGGTIVNCGTFGGCTIDKTYTVTFDSDGGSNVNSQMVGNTSAIKPADPKKDGYDFVGWYLGDTQYTFDTKITGDITLKAHWTPKSASTTITSAAVQNVNFNIQPGDAPQATAWVAVDDTDKYEIAYECWQQFENNEPVAAWYSDNGSHGSLPTITEFESGKEYVYFVMLKQKDEYSFSSETAVTVNGESVKSSLSGEFLYVPAVKSIKPVERKPIELIEINNVTTSFKVGDTPVFTGKVPADAPYYIDYEGWNSKDAGVTSSEYWNGRYGDFEGSWGKLLTSFEANTEYTYSTYLKLTDEAVQSGYYFDKEKTKLSINGKIVDMREDSISIEPYPYDDVAMFYSVLTMTPEAGGTTPSEKYTVTYTDGVDGEEIFKDQTYTVESGKATPAFSGTPIRDGYKFVGWSPAVTDTVTGNVTYTAQWEKLTPAEKYTVTYTDGVDGEEVFKDQTYTVEAGKATPAFNGTPTRKGYTFTGWKPAVAATVTGNATYEATWKSDSATTTPSDNKPGTGETTSPKTGDTSNMLLWFALLFVSGGVLTGVTVFDKRKRHSVK